MFVLDPLNQTVNCLLQRLYPGGDLRVIFLIGLGCQRQDLRQRGGQQRQILLRRR